MALKIRLARGGAKKRPHYRIIVAEASAPRDGKFLEKLGTYNPRLPAANENRILFNADRIQHWLNQGAKPTDRVSRFLENAGILPAKKRHNPIKGKPGKKAQERLKAAQTAAETPPEDAPAEPAPEDASAETPPSEPSEESPAKDAPAEDPSAEDEKKDETSSE